MNLLPRLVLAVAGIAAFAICVMLLAAPDLVAGLVPWPLSRLSAIFLASIMAAIGAPLLGIAISGELAAVWAGALNLLVANAGVAITCFAAVDGTPAGRPVLYIALAASVMGAIMVCVGLWSRGMPFLDRRPLPWPVRAAFTLFTVILLAVGVALVRALPNIFPWPLPRELSAVYGWIFLGAACYFACGVVKPVWGNAKGQMLGFLAYDLILIGPYIRHFRTVAPPMLPSLVVYVAVILLSALLCAYYLFISRDASPFARHVAPAGRGALRQASRDARHSGAQ